MMSDIGTIRRCPTCGEDYKIWEVHLMGGRMFYAMRCKKCTNTPEDRIFYGMRWVLMEDPWDDIGFIVEEVEGSLL